jgi:hypothetical protein
VPQPELELPDIATLTAGSDIRAFMQAGVPQALRRAALARIWSLDPAIRDFREMADYDWDFNVPGGAPGFGPLYATREQIEQWLTRIIPPEPKPEEVASVEGPVAAPAPPPCPSPASGRGDPAEAPDTPVIGPGAATASPLPLAGEGQGGGAGAENHLQADAHPERASAPNRPRRHGSATPT